MLVIFEGRFETGLSGHPGKAAKGLEAKVRGKKTVQQKFAPPAIFATYLCQGRLQEQRRREEEAERKRIEDEQRRREEEERQRQLEEQKRREEEARIKAEIEARKQAEEAKKRAAVKEVLDGAAAKAHHNNKAEEAAEAEYAADYREYEQSSQETYIRPEKRRARKATLSQALLALRADG